MFRVLTKLSKDPSLYKKQISKSQVKKKKEKLFQVSTQLIRERLGFESRPPGRQCPALLKYVKTRTAALRVVPPTC